MKIKRGFFSEDEQESYFTENEKTEFKSRLAFLNSHNGLRKNKTHLFIAPTGVGKSTFVRTLVRDVIFNNKDSRVFVWLTEETVDEFKSQLSYGLPSHEILNNIEIASEQESELEENTLKIWLEDYISMSEPDVVICDNITTSKLYAEKKVSEQSKIAHWFKRLAGYGNALFLIAHTGAEVRENQSRLIDENDIRGSKAITTLVEFLYILQPIWVNQTLYQFLKIKKHRGQDLMHGLYRLNYKKDIKAFENDISVDFEKFADTFKLRNKLAK